MAGAKDLGPLDWRTPIVDGAGRPSPEFQRRWNTQRGNNGLIGTVTAGSGAPTGTPSDGAEYVDTSTTPFTVYIGLGGAWHKAGVVVFTDLSDAPHSYSAHAMALVRVKATTDGVEFATQSAMLDTLGAPAAGNLLQRGASAWALVTISAVLDGISSTQGAVLYRGASAWAALAPGTSGDVLTTAGAGADPSWAAGGGGVGGGVTEFGISTRASPQDPQGLADNYFFGRAIFCPADGSINSVKFYATTAQSLNQVTPAVYADAGGTVGAMIHQGPQVIGISQGLNKFSLSGGAVVTKGQVVWVGYQYLQNGGGLANIAGDATSMDVFFYSGALQSGIPSGVNYTQRPWGTMWASTDP